MPMTAKARIATALVACVVGAYGGYLAFGSMPFIEDARGMAAVALILGFASRRIGGREGFQHPRAAFAGGLVSVALGIAAIVTENGLVLAASVASVVVLWIAAVCVTAADREDVRS